MAHTSLPAPRAGFFLGRKVGCPFSLGVSPRWVSLVALPKDTEKDVVHIHFREQCPWNSELNFHHASWQKGQGVSAASAVSASSGTDRLAGRSRNGTTCTGRAPKRKGKLTWELERARQGTRSRFPLLLLSLNPVKILVRKSAHCGDVGVQMLCGL